MCAARSSVLLLLLASLPSSRAACLPSTLAAQASSTCAVRYAGEVECWGDAAEWAGLSAWTAALGATAQISLGAAHACALLATGTIDCYGGSNANGELDAPPPPAGDAWWRLSAGSYTTCAVSARGAGACWGQGADGQAAVPANRTWRAIAPAKFHTCGIDDGGGLACWGATASYGRGVVPEGRRWASVAVAEKHTCAIEAAGDRDAGRLVCWGETPGRGQADPSSSPRVAEVEATGALWAQVLAAAPAIPPLACPPPTHPPPRLAGLVRRVSLLRSERRGRRRMLGLGPIRSDDAAGRACQVVGDGGRLLPHLRRRRRR